MTSLITLVVARRMPSLCVSQFQDTKANRDQFCHLEATHLALGTLQKLDPRPHRLVIGKGMFCCACLCPFDNGVGGI